MKVTGGPNIPLFLAKTENAGEISRSAGFTDLLRVDQKGNDANSANWRTRTFTYNSLSQLLTANNPESGTISYLYDSDGNVTRKTDARSIYLNYTYDALHRVTQKTSSDGSVPTTYFTYDAPPGGLTITLQNLVGRMSRAYTPTAQTFFSYDVMGRIVWQPTCSPSNCGVTRDSTTAAYDLAGNLTSLTYPSTRKVTYGYDAANRLNQATFDKFGATTVNYSYWSVPASVGGNAGFYPSGAPQYENFGNGLQQQTTLDQRLRPATATLAGSQTLLSRTYTYQANGNVSRIADGLVAGRSQNFTYDSLNRITSASTDATTGTDAWSQTFNLDPWGNLQQSGSMSFTVPANTKNQIYDAAHPTWYAYDAAGNMTGYYNGLSTQSYTWDAESMMKTAGGYTYTYDANGMRVRKRQDASPNAWTEYLYFGSNVLAERDQAGTWTDYIFAGGKRIAKAPASAATTGTEYYHGDHLGSARLMTNASGVQTWSATYLPFGQEWNPTSTTNHYKFTGKERDAESGMDYFGARYDSSAMGRFMSPDDPLYDQLEDAPQSWNLYGYVRNNPLSNIDPDGRDCVVQTRTGSQSETATVTEGNCDNVIVGEGQTKTYVAGTVTGISLGADGKSIDIGYKPYDSNVSAGVTNANVAPIPDHPGLAYGYNALGYATLAQASKTVDNIGKGYLAIYGTMGAVAACAAVCPAATEIAASRAASAQIANLTEDLFSFVLNGNNAEAAELIRMIGSTPAGRAILGKVMLVVSARLNMIAQTGPQAQFQAFKNLQRMLFPFSE